MDVDDKLLKRITQQVKEIAADQGLIVGSVGLFSSSTHHRRNSWSLSFRAAMLGGGRSATVRAEAGCRLCCGARQLLSGRNRSVA